MEKEKEELKKKLQIKEQKVIKANEFESSFGKVVEKKKNQNEINLDKIDKSKYFTSERFNLKERRKERIKNLKEKSKKKIENTTKTKPKQKNIDIRNNNENNSNNTDIHEILKTMIENGATDEEMELVAKNVRSFEKERKRANMVENISSQLLNFGATDDKINDILSALKPPLNLEKRKKCELSSKPKVLSENGHLKNDLLAKIADLESLIAAQNEKQMNKKLNKRTNEVYQRNDNIVLEKQLRKKNNEGIMLSSPEIEISNSNVKFFDDNNKMDEKLYQFTSSFLQNDSFRDDDDDSEISYKKYLKNNNSNFKPNRSKRFRTIKAKKKKVQLFKNPGLNLESPLHICLDSDDYFHPPVLIPTNPLNFKSISHTDLDNLQNKKLHAIRIFHDHVKNEWRMYSDKYLKQLNNLKNQIEDVVNNVKILI